MRFNILCMRPTLPYCAEGAMGHFSFLVRWISFAPVRILLNSPHYDSLQIKKIIMGISHPQRFFCFTFIKSELVSFGVCGIFRRGGSVLSEWQVLFVSVLITPL